MGFEMNTKYIYTHIIVNLIILVALAVGWVSNLMNVLNNEEITTLFIVQCIGILLAPLGAVLGFIYW